MLSGLIFNFPFLQNKFSSFTAAKVELKFPWYFSQKSNDKRKYFFKKKIKILFLVFLWLIVFFLLMIFFSGFVTDTVEESVLGMKNMKIVMSKYTLFINSPSDVFTGNGSGDDQGYRHEGGGGLNLSLKGGP